MQELTAQCIDRRPRGASRSVEAQTRAEKYVNHQLRMLRICNKHVKSSGSRTLTSLVICSGECSNYAEASESGEHGSNELEHVVCTWGCVEVKGNTSMVFM